MHVFHDATVLDNHQSFMEKCHQHLHCLPWLQVNYNKCKSGHGDFGQG